jgi:hypothetical protein
MDNFYTILGISILLIVVVVILLFTTRPSEIKEITNGSPYPAVNSRIKIINKSGTTFENIGTFDASGNFMLLNEPVPDQGSFVITVYPKQTELIINENIGAMLNVNGNVLFENVLLFFEGEGQISSLYSVFPTSEPLSPFIVTDLNENGECSFVTQMQQIPNTSVLPEASLWPVDPILIRNATEESMEMFVLLYDTDNSIIDGYMDTLYEYQSNQPENNAISVDISSVPEGGFVYILGGSMACTNIMSIVKDKGKLYYYYFLGHRQNTPHPLQILQLNGLSMPVAAKKIMSPHQGFKPSAAIMSKLKGKTIPIEIKTIPKEIKDNSITISTYNYFGSH